MLFWHKHLTKKVYFCLHTNHYTLKLLTHMNKVTDLSVIYSSSPIKFAAVSSFSKSSCLNQKIRKDNMHKLNCTSEVTSNYTVVSNISADYSDWLTVSFIRRCISKSKSVNEHHLMYGPKHSKRKPGNNSRVRASWLWFWDKANNWHRI